MQVHHCRPQTPPLAMHPTPPSPPHSHAHICPGGPSIEQLPKGLEPRKLLRRGREGGAPPSHSSHLPSRSP
eukprot:3456955-Prymnesium_polylepis.1